MALYFDRPGYRLVPLAYRYRPFLGGFNSSIDDMMKEMMEPVDLLHRRVGNLEKMLTDDEEGESPLGYAGGHLAEAFRDPKKFQVSLNLAKFRPEEIRVELEDNKLHVHAEHQEKNADGYEMWRRFNQYYTLPEGVQLDKIESALHSDGYLILKAPIEPPSSEEKKVTPIAVKCVDTPAVVAQIPDEADDVKKTDEPEKK